MNLIESIKEAVGSIAANKTRAFLTVLGIMIGVGAVIAMLAIGQGAQSSITGQIESVGTNMMIIMRGNTAAEVKTLGRLPSAMQKHWQTLCAHPASVM